MKKVDPLRPALIAVDRRCPSAWTGIETLPPAPHRPVAGSFHRSKVDGVRAHPGHRPGRPDAADHGRHGAVDRPGHRAGR